MDFSDGQIQIFPQIPALFRCRPHKNSRRNILQ